MFLPRTTLSCALCPPLPNYDLLIVVPDVLVPRRVCPACLHRYRLTSSFCTLLQAKKDLTSIRHNVRVGCLRARELSLHLASVALQRFRIPSVCTGNPIPTRRSETIFQVSNSESCPPRKEEVQLLSSGIRIFTFRKRQDAGCPNSPRAYLSASLSNFTVYSLCICIKGRWILL